MIKNKNVVDWKKVSIVKQLITKNFWSPNSVSTQ